ncbi:MAG: nucleotidyltransferase family protein [Anaerolineaceae bacterium]|nr:nucleotidyltransferase family protein [Anaerolineaceae bacterium]
MKLLDSFSADLQPHEVLLWQCAVHWRQPAAAVLPDEVDWPALVRVGLWNRAQTLLLGFLAAQQGLAELPTEPLASLQEGAARFRQDAAVMGESLQIYLHKANERGIETAVLKGLSVSANVYGDTAVRPGGDIDVLVRQRDVAGSIEILDEMEIGQNWPNLMDDRYYERHHLHQQRCTPDLRLWYEVHWALDHPLTCLTIDYEAVMDRATPGTLLGAPVADLSLPDLLLSLTIHLVKHAIYLPSVLDHPDLARIILADGMLMYFVDVAEVMKQHEGEIDWRQTVELAQAWGAVEMLGSVLQVCHGYLDAPVPAWVLDALPVTGPNLVKQWVMQKVVAYETAVHLGNPPSKLWKLLLITNGAFILRPIRLLDLLEYCFPGRDFLRRRYGSGSTWRGVYHFFRAMGQYGRITIDTFYFTWERYWRLRRQNYSTSLFNRLEVDA